MNSAQTQTNTPSARKWRVLVSIVFGIFMVILDTTVVNVAFQTLRSEFGASLNDSQWIISIYVLALGISTPLAAFLADRFGMKETYLTGLSIFAIGSLLCGLSPSLGFMIAARALQGFGGGIALPLGSAFLLRTFPPEEQGTALGIFGIAALFAPTVGPILGGFLVDRGLWRYIFFINPPIGVIGVILGSIFLPRFTAERKPRLDFLGLVTEIVGFGSVLYAASVAANQGWSAPGVWEWFAVGAAGLVAFAIVELFIAKDPLLDLRLFLKRTFLNAALLGYVSVLALFGAEFLLPIYLQALRGYTALNTGVLLLPMALSGGITTILAGRLYDRLGPRPLVTFGFALLIVNTWQLSQLKADTPISWLLFLLALRGLAFGATVQTTFVTALSVVPVMEIANGSSLVNATRQVVQSIGVAILASVLASALSPQIASLQQSFQDISRPAGTAPLAICSPSPQGIAALVNQMQNDPRPQVSPNVNPGGPAGGPSAGGNPAPNPGGVPNTGVPNAQTVQALLNQACQQNITGFEQAYKVTFYAAIVALILGVLLPGWPFKWAGRRAADRAGEQ